MVLLGSKLLIVGGWDGIKRRIIGFKGISINITGGAVIRYTEGVSIRYTEGASIRYRALRSFRKRGGYKVQLNFRQFFSIFSDQFNFYLCNYWVNIDDSMVIARR